MGDVIEVPGMTESEMRSAVLAEVAGAHGLRYQRPFEFTRAEFMAATGAKYETASRRLGELVAAGKLRVAHAIVNGRQALVYWRPEDEVL